MSETKDIDRPLRIGIIGCGLIAQVMHLHYLRELADEFEVVAVCDLSESIRDFAADSHCPRARRYADWSDVLDEEPDAVMILTPGSHAPVAIAAAERGIHVFVEKPMCYSPAEAAAMIAAAERAGTVLMVGNMRRYDPAYEKLGRLLGDVGDLRFVRATTMEAPFEPYLTHLPLRLRADDVDQDQLAVLRAADRERLERALGPRASDPRLVTLFEDVLLLNLVHEVNALRGLLGEPTAVRSAIVGADARSLTVDLAFGGAECSLAWVDLPGLADYRQELTFLAPDNRLTLTFPSPYLRSMPTALTIARGSAGSAELTTSQEVVSYEEAFKRELLELSASIRSGRAPRTDGHEGAADIALLHRILDCAAG